VFIEEYFGVQLKDVQKVVARSFGNCNNLYVVKSRGFGKTWLTALCCLAMGVLYPGSLIAVVSGTAEQATLVLRKVEDELIKNPNILREISQDGYKPVQLLQSKAKCRLRNGSKIESYSIGTMRGNRAKIVVVDEAPEVSSDDLNAIVSPVRNTTRGVSIQRGFKDYPSKLVSITSACLKSNYFYDLFIGALKDMSKGDLTTFGCALDYSSAARCGITDIEYFLEERRKMPESKFQMEYGSIFVGAEAGSAFPYDLTESCRTLRTVEAAAPKSGVSSYVMGVDLATSSAKSADNAVISVIKLAEKQDGSYQKKMVYMQSFHGKRLDALADEVRRILVRFPNTIKIVFDHRGLGDAFPLFLSQPWIDPESGAEYPPLVLDDERNIIQNAKPILRSVKGNLVVNQQLFSAVRVALEQKSLQLPVSSKMIFNGKLMDEDDDDSMKNVLTLLSKKGKGKDRTLSSLEKAIYIEADALQVEMGNIVSKMTGSGTYVYETAKTTQHKDRYSSLAMAVRFIAELEEERKKRIALANNNAGACVGIFTAIQAKRRW